MSDSVRPHRQQPTRLASPWDSPGKNSGVGCHFLLQCMKVKSEREVTQSCLTLCDPIDCSPPGSSDHWIFQARVLEWGATGDFKKEGTPMPHSTWYFSRFHQQFQRLHDHCNLSLKKNKKEKLSYVSETQLWGTYINLFFSSLA